MANKSYTIEFKRTTVETVLKLKANGIGASEIETLVGIRKDHSNKWIVAYKRGDFDEKPEEAKPIATELKTLQEIDIRPQLERIAKAIETSNESLRALTEGMVKVCLRLDSIYQKNLEDHETFDSLLAKGFKKAGNGDKS